MPKKEGAKEKAANKAQAEAEARAKAAEDASWADDDKGKAKKDGKKGDAEAKRLEELQRKQERKKLEEEEEAALSKGSKAPAKKVTQFEIQQNLAAPAAKAKSKPAKEPEIEKNINHEIRETEEEFRAAGIEKHVASGVGEATELLRNLTAAGSDSPDSHPERRRKAAFKAYEDREVPKIRAENPGLKLSQIKEIVFKNWQKSPENPMNESE